MNDLLVSTNQKLQDIVKELEELLFSNMRIDESEFEKLNMSDLAELCGLYHSNNMKCLKKMMRLL